MTQLQKIVAKAKILKKSHPNTKWTDLIKKASKLVTPASKSVAGTKNKKTVKKYAPVKPLAKKKKAVKRSTSRSSESEKIRSTVKKDGFIMPHGYQVTKGKKVMSGTNGSEQFVKQLNSLLSDKKKLETDLNIYKQRKKENVKFSPFNALHFKRLPSMIKSVNTQIREAKKHIK